MESCGAEFEVDMGSCYEIILGVGRGRYAATTQKLSSIFSRNLTVANFHPSKICMHIQ
jgi:hypothetical protein